MSPSPSRQLSRLQSGCPLGLAAVAAVGLTLSAPLMSACSGTSSAEPTPGQPAGATAAGATTDGPRDGTAGGTAVLAFAGDVHFEGVAAGTTDLGSAFEVLADADLAVVNLETAVTTGGTRVDKQFAFRAPPPVMSALAGAGVDAVSLANNHGMDYGATGLTDTLAAGRAAGLPVIGAGDDVAAAFAPLRAEPQGVPVSVIAATDVLDSAVETAWTATRAKAGLASAKDSARLLADVEAEKAAGRVVVVFLHWGTERVPCPSARQEALAADLTRAGADVVVGSHAHVLEPTAEVTAGGSTAFVAYGLGNFHFYARPGPGAQTGVLTVAVDAGGVTGSQWHPAEIVAGRPELLTTAELEGGPRGLEELAELGERCAAGLVPTPPERTGPGGPPSPGADAPVEGADAPDGADAAVPPTSTPPTTSRTSTATGTPTGTPTGTATGTAPTTTPTRR